MTTSTTTFAILTADSRIEQILELADGSHHDLEREHGRRFVWLPMGGRVGDLVAVDDDGEATVVVEDLTITVSNVRPSAISGCETGLDMDVRVNDHQMQATLLPGASMLESRGPYLVWGSPDNWLSDPSRYSREQLLEIADACEEAAAKWSAAN